MTALSALPALSDRLAHFAPISLQALNDRAAMMERLDQKYVVPEERLAAALPIFAERFDVLEIDGNGRFPIGRTPSTVTAAAPTTTTTRAAANAARFASGTITRTPG